jgi:hypothetical protein
VLKNVTFLLLLVPSFAGAAISATIVEDTDRTQLVILQDALERTFNKKCNDISQIGDKFILDVSNCVPAGIRNVLGKRALIGGPNCYNFALYASGVLDTLRAVNSDEVDEQFFTPNSSTCSEIKTLPQPGQIVSLERKTAYGNRKIHAYFHLTDKYALTKNGPGTDSYWEISTLDQINAQYPIPAAERIAVQYNCVRKKKPQLPGSKEIRGFSKLISEAQLASHIPANLQEVMTANITHLEAILNAENIKGLDSSDPIRLYELVAQLYVVKNFYYSLHESQLSIESFRPSAEKFLEILSRILDVSQKKYGINDVSNPEDSLEYDYCANHQASICSVGIFNPLND